MPERVDFDREEGTATTRRQIGKSGNSMVIRIPPGILQVAGMEYEDDVELTADMEEGTITVRKVQD